MARFISIDEILHRGRFAKDAKKAHVKEAATRAQTESKAAIITDSEKKADTVEVVETPVNVEPTITDAPAAEVVEVVTDAPAAEEANIVEEETPVVETPAEEAAPAAPKKKGGKKAKAAEEAAE